MKEMTNNELLIGDLKRIKQKLYSEIQILEERKEKIGEADKRLVKSLRIENRKLKDKLSRIEERHITDISVLKTQIHELGGDNEVKSTAIRTEQSREDSLISHIKQSKSFKEIPKDIDINRIKIHFTIKKKKKPIGEIIRTTEGLTRELL